MESFLSQTLCGSLQALCAVKDKCRVAVDEGIDGRRIVRVEKLNSEASFLKGCCCRHGIPRHTQRRATVPETKSDEGVRVSLGVLNEHGQISLRHVHLLLQLSIGRLLERENNDYESPRGQAWLDHGNQQNT